MPPESPAPRRPLPGTRSCPAPPPGARVSAPREHRLRQIGPHYHPVGPDPPGQGERGIPGSRADIEHPVARLDRACLNELLGVGPLLEDVAPTQPSFSRLVPLCALALQILLALETCIGHATHSFQPTRQLRAYGHRGPQSAVWSRV